MRRRLSLSRTPPALIALALFSGAAWCGAAWSGAAWADGAAPANSAAVPTAFDSAPPPASLNAPQDPAAATPVLLPTFAQGPSSDPWAGLSIGGGVSVFGGKGVKGGVGGDAYLSYDKELSNHLVIGVEGVSGYAPSLFTSRAGGFNYGGINVKVGYDMGRFEPYLTAGVGVAKADFGAPHLYDTSDSLDTLLNKGGGPSLTTTTVGAGFNYAVTNNFSMGLSITAVHTQWNSGSISRPDAP